MERDEKEKWIEGDEMREKVNETESRGTMEERAGTKNISIRHPFEFDGRILQLAVGLNADSVRVATVMVD
jgi:hypothetical protein